MMRGMYSAISGLRNHQIMLDVTANDLANVNTVGFKASRTSFRDSLAQLQRSGASATPGQRRREVGPDRPRRPARLDRQPHDQRRVPVDGQPVRRRHHRHRLVPRVEHRPDRRRPAAAPDTFPGGSTYEYTRAGNFTLNDQGELATQDGWRVVGKGVDTTTGGPTTTDIVIKVPTGATDVSVATDGAVTYTPAGGGARATAGFLSLAAFPNESGLDRCSANRWKATGSSGAEAVGTPAVNGLGQTIGGQLEMSNVDLATEFTNMITAQRGFEASSRVLSTTDEMLQTLVNLKH